MSENQANKLLPLGYTVAQTAQLFNRNRLWVYRLAKAGKINIIKVSERSSLVTRDSLVKYAIARGLTVTFLLEAKWGL